MHWFPLVFASKDLQERAKYKKPQLGQTSCIVITAVGSDGRFHKYAVDFQVIPAMYIRLPDLEDCAP